VTKRPGLRDGRDAIAHRTLGATDRRTPLLELKQIAKTCPGARALREVDFALEAGEVHALLGENGAGKSTMIKIITGMETADEGGSIRMAGEIVAEPSPRHIQAMGIAAVYQAPTLFNELRVAENLCLGEEGAVISWGRFGATRRQRRLNLH